MISNLELKLKSILDTILVGELYFDNYRPDWLKNNETGHNLELDRYYPNLGLGIECNGIQHRKKNDIEQWKRDKLKKHLCGKHNVIRVVFYAKEINFECVYKKLSDYIAMRTTWLEHKSYKKNIPTGVETMRVGAQISS